MVSSLFSWVSSWGSALQYWKYPNTIPEIGLEGSFTEQEIRSHALVKDGMGINQSTKEQSCFSTMTSHQQAPHLKGVEYKETWLPLGEGLRCNFWTDAGNPYPLFPIPEFRLHIKKLIPFANTEVRVLLATWQSHSTTAVLSCSVSTLSLSQVSTFP